MTENDDFYLKRHWGRGRGTACGKSRKEIREELNALSDMGIDLPEDKDGHDLFDVHELVEFCKISYWFPEKTCEKCAEICRKEGFLKDESQQESNS